MPLYREIHVEKLFKAGTTVSAGVTISSYAIDLGDHAQSGNLSLQLVVASTKGSVTAVPKVSAHGDYYIWPSGQGNIVTDFASTSGVESNGWVLESFSVPVCRFMRIDLWNSSLTEITLKGDLIIQ